jgi:hypothetical protein
MVFYTVTSPYTPLDAMVPVKYNGGGHSYYGLCPGKSISWLLSRICGPSHDISSSCQGCSIQGIQHFQAVGIGTRFLMSYHELDYKSV